MYGFPVTFCDATLVMVHPLSYVVYCDVSNCLWSFCI